MYPKALAAAQESWVIRRDEYPNYSVDYHLNNLVEISLHLRNAEQAGMYLRSWEIAANNTMPKSRERLSCRRQSDLARLEGRFPEAVDWARRAMLTFNNPLSGMVMVRAFLCTGDRERAREELIRCLTLRDAESGHFRYYIRLLEGDYCLACARHTAGLAPVDDEFGLEFPLPDRIANPTATRNALAWARKAYNAALEVGCSIDEKLDCTKRKEEIAQRLKRVEAIEQRL